MSVHCSCVDLNLFFLQVKIAEFSTTPEDFLRKYDEIKSKNVRTLDPLVYLLSKLSEDKEVKDGVWRSPRIDLPKAAQPVSRPTSWFAAARLPLRVRQTSSRNWENWEKKSDTIQQVHNAYVAFHFH